VKKGDIVGCGVNFIRREIFYTLNGKFLGVAFKDVNLKDYFVIVGLHGTNESVTINFAKTKPFVFDLEAMLSTLEAEAITEINEETVSVTDVQHLVHNYLLHYGYNDTLQVFDKSTGIRISQAAELPGATKQKKGKTRCSEKVELEDFLFSPSRKKQKTDLLDADEGSDIGVLSSAVSERNQRAGAVTRARSQSMSFSAKRRESRSDSMAEFLEETGSEAIDSLKTQGDGFTNHGEQNGMNGHKRVEITRASSLPLANGHSDKHFHSLKLRGDIRHRLIEGDVDAAKGILEKRVSIPPSLEDQTTIHLNCQKFIELVKEEKVLEATQFACDHLAEHQCEVVFRKQNHDGQKVIRVQELMGLLCYKDVNESSLADLISTEQRDLIADEVNKKILESLERRQESSLEVMIRQLVTTRNLGDEVFHLDTDKNLSLKLL